MSTKNRAKSAIRQQSGQVSFGEMLHSYRIANEITQTDFAERLQISKQDLCNIEKGRKLVSVERAVSFARLIGMPEKTFAKYALQDQLTKAGVSGKVSIVA